MGARATAGHLDAWRLSPWQHGQSSGGVPDPRLELRGHQPPLFDLAALLHDVSDTAAIIYVDRVLDAWRDHASRPDLDQYWRAVKPLEAVMEILKFTARVDAAGPAHEATWLPMVYGWARRLLRASDFIGWPG